MKFSFMFENNTDLLCNYNYTFFIFHILLRKLTSKLYKNIFLYIKNKLNKGTHVAIIIWHFVWAKYVTQQVLTMYVEKIFSSFWLIIRNKLGRISSLFISVLFSVLKKIKIVSSWRLWRFYYSADVCERLDI